MDTKVTGSLSPAAGKCGKPMWGKSSAAEKTTKNNQNKWKSNSYRHEKTQQTQEFTPEKETQLKNIKNKWKILNISSKKRLTSDLYIHHAINHTIKKEHYLQSANSK